MKRRLKTGLPKAPVRPKSHRKKILIGLIMVSVVVAIFAVHYGYQRYNRDREIKALGIENQDVKITERHLWITRNIPNPPIDTNEIPVHIVYRKNTSNSWLLVGSGTLFPSLPGKIVVSAYHVFEGTRGQYGWRKISREELNGSEPVVPIEGFNPPNAPVDDAIVCRSGQIDGAFPTLDLPFSTNKFYEFRGNQPYTAQRYEHALHLLTYPKTAFPGGFTIEVKPGVQYIFFIGDVEPGESGTGGWCDGETKDHFCVVIRHYPMSVDEVSDRFGLPRHTTYTVAYCVKIGPK